MFNKKLISVSTLAIALLLFSMVAAGPALAARGGGSGGGGKPPKGGGTTCTACVLTVSPNPVPAYTQPTVNGTGFVPGEMVRVSMPGDLAWTDVTADSSGHFSFVYSHRGDLQPWPNYTIEARALRGGTWVVLASVTFAVV